MDDDRRVGDGARIADVNAALFCNFEHAAFISDALAPFLAGAQPCVISDDQTFLPAVALDRRIGFAALDLDAAPLDGEEILARLRERLSDKGGLSCVVVDMNWGLAAVHGAASYETWGDVADVLAAETGAPVLSLYDKEMMIEDQMQAAFRAHRQFLAPSGLYENPFWLPRAMLRDATLDERLAFMLGRVAPDYAGESFFRDPLRQAARGAAPDWAARGREFTRPEGRATRWHIQCFGRLTVHVGGDRPVDWRIAGGAPKKTRTLFAYLLQKGEGGAHAEQIGELLWPEGGASEKTKRARLHHTVAMLRKALGGRDAVLRDGDFYRLAMPPGSWIDIASFEQLCRRGLSLNRHGQHAAALRVYFAAERIYAGDLFADLPLDHIQSETDDWCLPKRIWLREMALKLQHDMAGLLLREGRTGEALEHALKALAIEPASVAANIVAMRIFHAQNRVEAVHRQYRQYRAAAAAVGDGDSEPGEIEAAYAQLCTPRPARKSQPGKPLPTPQRKTIAGRIR